MQKWKILKKKRKIEIFSLFVPIISFSLQASSMKIFLIMMQVFIMVENGHFCSDGTVDDKLIFYVLIEEMLTIL